MVTGPENAVSQVERRHSDVAPVLGGRVCFVVGDEDGNRSFFLAFLKNKLLIPSSSPTTKQTRPPKTGATPLCRLST